MTAQWPFNMQLSTDLNHRTYLSGKWVKWPSKDWALLPLPGRGVHPDLPETAQGW